jgi:hypothetical protein
MKKPKTQTEEIENGLLPLLTHPILFESEEWGRLPIVSIDFKKGNVVAILENKHKRFGVDDGFIIRETMFRDKNGKRMWENDIVSVIYKVYDESMPNVSNPNVFPYLENPSIEDLLPKEIQNEMNGVDYKLGCYIAKVDICWEHKYERLLDKNDEEITTLMELDNSSEIEILGTWEEYHHLLTEFKEQ